VIESLKNLRQKLDHYLKQEATAIDPDQKFALTTKIKETTSRIADLESQAVTSRPRNMASLGGESRRND
jgi:hypothetical protein